MSTSCVIVRAAAHAAFCLAVGSVTQAADKDLTSAKESLDIHVQAEGFGRASPADINSVLQSAASEIWRNCPRTKIDGIDVYHRADHPQTDFKRTRDGRISIGLSSRDTYWAQYSFQFAHEFCHVLANFGDHLRRSAFYPHTANLWLEESLCEAGSLFVLRAMSRSWRNASSYPAWRSYAPSLNDYVEERLALPEHHLPTGTPFLVWFRKNQQAMRQNSALRDRNTIVAIQLLPLFNAEPRGWEALTFLNRGSSDKNQSLARHLAEWDSLCPTDLRPFVVRIAAVFAVKL